MTPAARDSVDRDTVLLGNTAPVEVTRDEDDEVVRESITERLGITPRDRKGPDGTITTFRLVPGDSFPERFTTVTRTYDGYHSDDAPEWVECGDPVMQRALAEHYTRSEVVDPETGDVLVEAHGCHEGRPDRWTAYGEKI